PPGAARRLPDRLRPLRLADRRQPGRAGLLPLPGGRGGPPVPGGRGRPGALRGGPPRGAVTSTRRADEPVSVRARSVSEGRASRAQASGSDRFGPPAPGGEGRKSARPNRRAPRRRRGAGLPRRRLYRILTVAALSRPRAGPEATMDPAKTPGRDAAPPT